MIIDLLPGSFEIGHFSLLAVSAFVSIFAILAAPTLPRLCGRADIQKSIQAMHSRPTPRVGGLGLFAAMVLGIVLAPVDLAVPYSQFLLATSVLFLVGLCEDLGFSVSPAHRLIAAMAASLLVILLLGVWLPRVGIPVADELLPYWFIGIPFTLFATAGVANGFNLIDGINGLAAVTAIAAALAFAQIAEVGNYPAMVELCLILTAGIIGFLLLNFPFGLVFLGDAGAYTMGFVLGWFGIAILLNVPEVSPWAILLCVFWPVADTLLAIHRRRQRKCAAMAPDRLHVHQMVMRTLELCMLGRSRRRIANPLTTLVLTPFIVMPPTVAVMFWNDNFIAFLATLGFAFLFIASYRMTPVLARKFRTRAVSASPISA